jgi:glycosyltransferase involved in cell wall biosynthesis
MRVALVTHALHVGGMEAFLFRLSDALRSRGIEVAFVITERVGVWQRRAENSGFETIEVLPSKWRSRRWHAQQLAAVLKDFNAVILNHCESALPIVGQLPPSCLLISVLHNDHDEIYRVGLGNVSNVDFVVGVSSKIMSEAARRGASAAQLRHIPYGVEVPTSWPKSGQAPNGRPLKVVFLGRIDDSQKGVFDIPPILAAAQQRGVEMRLEMVGDGPDKTILQRQLADGGSQVPVVLHGSKDHAEAIRLLSAADVLLMPSRYEGLPINLLEALAHGIVPVASHLPGITDDAVANGVNGLLLPVGDCEGFARAIARLQDHAERLRMSQAGWQTAADKFAVEVMSARYVELLAAPRRVRPRDAGTGDAIGRKCYGLKWSTPIGFAVLFLKMRRIIEALVGK